MELLAFADCCQICYPGDEAPAPGDLVCRASLGRLHKPEETHHEPVNVVREGSA
jgi:hypothetical protein